MALPVDIATITVTGTYLSPSGTALTGTVTFTPSTPVLVDTTGQVLLGGVGVTVALTNGSFSVVLPCTGQMTPSNWSWTVTETIGGLSPRSYSVNIPHSLGSTVDISTLSPIVPGSVVVTTPAWVSVKSYGATGNGTTDDTAAINNAINAVGAAGGGVVYFPQGTYLTSGTLTIAYDGVRLVGDGKGNTTIKPVTGANFDVIATGIPATSGAAGFIRNHIGVEHFKLDCSQMSGTTSGAGNGIHFYGVRYSYIRDCWINSCPNWGILLDGDATNFSYSTDIRANRIVNGAAGIMVTFSEESFVTSNNILQANLNTAAQQPVFGTQSNVGYLMRCVAGYTGIIGNVFGSSGTYTSAALQVENSGPTRIEGNRFDQCRYMAIRTTGPNSVIIGNQIGNPSSVGSVEGIRVGSDNNVVVGNKFDLTNGAAHFTYAIAEAGGPYTSNIIANNGTVAGTSGVISLNATSTAKVYGNANYNPVGNKAPAVSSSGVAYTNNFGSDAAVFVTGGTVTVIAIGGVATGLTSGSFRVPSGQTITLTYSVAPTWTWFLD